MAAILKVNLTTHPKEGCKRPDCFESIESHPATNANPAAVS